MKWTIRAACQEFNIDHITLKKRIIASGLTYEQDQKYTTMEIVAAYCGSLQQEKIKIARNEAALLEIELAEKKGELVPAASVEQAITAVMVPLRAQLLAIPSVIATRCNSAEPEVARVAIKEELERILRELGKETEADPFE